MIHKLKTWPYFFSQIWAGVKPFEVRKNDRDFKIGDTLILQEFDPDNIEYSNREITCEVVNVLSGDSDAKTWTANSHTIYGLEKGFCIMGIKILSMSDPKGSELHTVSN